MMAARTLALGVAGLLALSLLAQRLQAQADTEAPSLNPRTSATAPGSDAELHVEEVVVHAVRPVRPATELGVSARQAEKTAGTQGDAAKVVQSLPGVARSGAQGEPVVWGAAPRETGIFIDNVPVPFLFHGSGVRSVIPSPWLSAVRLVPGAYDLSLGRHLGGVVRLETSDANVLDRELAISADTLDTAVLLGAPLSPDAALRVGGRYGYLAHWLPQVINEEARALYAIPEYWDAEAQGYVALSEDATLKVQLIAAEGRSQQGVLATASGQSTAQQTTRAFGRLYAVYEHNASNQSTRITPYVGLDEQRQGSRGVGPNTGVELDSWMLGLRMEHTERLTADLQLRLGFDGQFQRVTGERSGSLTVPPREGDPRVFGLPSGRDYVVDPLEVRTLGVAPYLSCELKAGPVAFEPGLRVDGFLVETARNRPPVGDIPDTGTSRLSARPAPRLSVGWTVEERLRVFAAISRHHQEPDAIDLTASSGNPELPEASATHLVAGQTAKLLSTLSLEVMLFYKWLERLATRTDDASPAPGRVLEARGTGEVFGAQFMVRLQELLGFHGWLSATLSRSLRRDRPEASERRFDFDQPLVASLVLSRDFEAWSLGARARFAMGFPRPAVVAADYNLLEDRYEPVLSQQRWWRLPPFFALDLRAERKLMTTPTLALAAYLEVLNATHHSNAEEVIYSWDYRERRYLRGLPATAILGVKLWH